MPGPWKEWKTKPRYSTLPTVPWKSRIHREISTFPPPRLPAHGKLENQKTVSHFPMRWKRRRLRFPSLLNPNPKKGRRPLRSLLTLPTFRIILYWNQNPVSGSFLDWKMLRLQQGHRRSLQVDSSRPAQRIPTIVDSGELPNVVGGRSVAARDHRGRQLSFRG